MELGPAYSASLKRTNLHRTKKEVDDMLGFLYGVVVYGLFLGTFLYSIGFVGNIIVPKSIDGAATTPFLMAVVINLAVLSVFALQHSVMARPAFKRIWTKIIPASVERVTYILMTSLALILLYRYWQPIPGVVWNLEGTLGGQILFGTFLIGWGIVLLSTFMIDHFDLFGLRQVFLALKKQTITHGGFRKNWFYKLVRHPIMTGFLIAFWAAPVMTYGHLLFAVVTTAYIYIAVKHFEEKDLIDEIGEDYIAYCEEVGAFVPGLGKSRKAEKPVTKTV